MSNNSYQRSNFNEARITAKIATIIIISKYLFIQLKPFFSVIYLYALKTQSESQIVIV